MKARNKRLKVFSVTGILAIIVLFTLPNISWVSSVDNKDTVSVSVPIADSAAVLAPSIVFSNYVNDIYEAINLQQAGLALPVFEKALTGFVNLKSNHHLNNNKEILTVVDFTKSSKEKRMWIIDLKNNKILLNTYVAHGRGSGDDMATTFSNISESHQSSLGFYVTNETYQGKHGLSLKLDGFDKGINHLARARAIVVHGADYVSEQFISQHGRLGRSHGCPAVPAELNKTVIDLIKDKTCLFINGNSNNYHSNLLDTSLASENFIGQSNS
jgi:hypothetical protein